MVIGGVRSAARVVHRSLFETILGASLWGLSGNAAQALFQEYRFSVNGLVAGLLSAFSGAYYTIGSKQYVREHGAWWITSYGFTIGGLIALPFGVSSLWNYQLPATPTDSLRFWTLLSFVVLFGTFLAFGLYVSGLKHLTATETGVASSLEPIVSALAAYGFPRDRATTDAIHRWSTHRTGCCICGD